MKELEAVRGDWPAALAMVIAHFKAESGTVHLMGPDGALHLKGMAGLAAERKQPVTVCNIQTDTSGDVRPGAKLTGMEGAIASPMLAGDKVVGVLGVANRGARTFTDEEEAGLMEAGRVMGEWA